MKRRDLLESVGSAGLVGLAGCVQSEPGRSPPAESSEQRSVSITASDDIAESTEVRIDPTVTEPRLTEEHPPRVTIETTNTGEKRYFASMQGGLLFNIGWGGDYSESPPGLILLGDKDPPGEYPPEEGTWQYDPPNVDGPASGIVIDADETVTTEYLVLDNPDESGYFSPDEYRFEERVDIQLFRDETPVPGSTANFTWGFSLQVT